MHNVIIPDSGNGLLRRELALAFEEAGCRVILASPENLWDKAHPHYLPELASRGKALLFSINFHGLDRLKETMAVMKDGNGRIAVWCVDNPWNLLSGVRDPQWKELPFFVTDQSFLSGLNRHGATHARHLPLAASPELFAAPLVRESVAPLPDLAPVVFVGRSAFPGREAFYAGLTLPDDALSEATAMMNRGERPDLSWWIKRLGRDAETFWPGKKQRLPSLGAEKASFFWRATCLEKAAACGPLISLKNAPQEKNVALDIFGDKGWLARLPENTRLLPPVDYYNRLPALYAKARYSLALTSMQLPSGLNQRHFDVWTAGGLCVTDATPGLSLFPEELVRPVAFQKPDDIIKTLHSLESRGAAFRKQLIADWQSEIFDRHTYARRVAAVLEAVDAL